MFQILALLVTALSFSADKDTTELKRATNKTVQSIRIDTDKLRDVQENESYQYKPQNVEKNFLQKAADWISAKWNDLMEWIFGDKQGNEILSFIINYLPYLLLAIGIFIIIRLLYRYDVFKKSAAQQKPPDIRLADDEEIVKSSNISDLVNKAKEENNYRMAIRYLYLNVLRQLDLQEFIKFTKNKTNDDYNAEIKNKAIAQEFKDLTYYYDFIWYGQYPVDRAFFDQIEEKFNRFLAQTSKKAA